MVLPFRPETLEQMKKRLNASLETIYEEKKIGAEQNPAKDRKHSFDFTDGVRLVIYRDRNKLSRGLHIWASSFKRAQFTEQEFLNIVLKHVADLGGMPGKIFEVQTKENVMHITFPEMPEQLRDAIRPANPILN